MCGRYTLTSQDAVVAELELAIPTPVDGDWQRAVEKDPASAGPPRPSPHLEWWRPRFNIAPTQWAAVVANRAAPPALELMRWGLIPSWADDVRIGARMINARVETLAGKPAFRDALRRRRCLVVADGFFEWTGTGKDKQAHYLRPVPHRIVTFAGLWERWRQPDGSWLTSFAIITGPPNELVEPLHDRMPVVIAAADRARWLHTEPLPPEALADLLVPPPVGDWAVIDVSRRVGSPDNDDPACIEPAPP